jgi:glutathione-S-conjugate glycine hydrolase
MPGEWIRLSRLRAALASLVLIGGLIPGAAQADPLYLPTPMGTERFGRSAVNPSVLKVLGYAETESRQTFCGPTSLAIAMNSLGVNDPTPPSLFPWHLVTQETVFTPANLAVKSYAEVDRSGLMLDQLARFATNLKLSASVLHAADLSAADMRARLITAIGQPDSRVIVNFNRASLGQEGEGHFSPLVAYDPTSDSFLILDVARYKYPPAWVAFKDLDISMRTVDPDSGLSRGVLIVTRSAAAN